jgi:hypothetical protein
VDAATESKLHLAAALLTTDSLARAVFCYVNSHAAVTGYQVARGVNQPPRVVRQILAELVHLSVMRADGNGLTAYYVPSAGGFRLRQRMAG